MRGAGPSLSRRSPLSDGRVHVPQGTPPSWLPLRSAHRDVPVLHEGRPVLACQQHGGTAAPAWGVWGPEPNGCAFLQFLFLSEVLQWRAQTTPDHVLYTLLNCRVRLSARPSHSRAAPSPSPSYWTSSLLTVAVSHNFSLFGTISSKEGNR